MLNKASFEIFRTKFWDFGSEDLHAAKKMLDASLTGKAWEQTPDSEGHTPGTPFLTSVINPESKVYAGDALRISRWNDLDPDDVVVNVMPVEGPIIREPGACSYGSVEYRDWMLQASEIPQCVGHIFLINTPGGSAYAKNDFQYAIDRVRAKGQPVIALVDGMCCSAGMALAAMCDEIYFINPLDRIGCIGTMCAFYATPDGATNTISQERYVEVYGSDSEFKNKEYRDAAQGDYAMLQKEVDELNAQFLALVHRYRPKVKEEQIHGKVYNCGEVVGTLTDGQSTMQSCIERVLEKAGKKAAAKNSGSRSNASAAASPATNTTSQHTETENSITNPSGQEVAPEQIVPSSPANSTTGQNQNNQMKEYSKIQAALGLEVLASDKENGIYFNETLADQLEAFLAEQETVKMTRDAKIQEVSDLNAKIKQMNEEHAQALEDLKAAHATEIEGINQTHNAALEAKAQENEEALQKSAAALNESITELQAQITALQAEKEELTKSNAEKDAEIQELSSQPAGAELPAPASTNEVHTPEQVTASAVCNSSMSYEQKKDALRARKEMISKMRG